MLIYKNSTDLIFSASKNIHFGTLETLKRIFLEFAAYPVSDFIKASKELNF